MSSFYRRQLLSSLRVEREQIFNEKILANMPVGIALVDPAGERFLHANSTFHGDRPFARRTCRARTEITQATFAQVAVASREALARVLHFGVPFQAIEQRTPTANGQTRYLTTNLLRLQDSQQRTLGVLCLVEDSTAAVTLRQELINANASKDQFLAQLSHELRNPLSPVITMVAELETVADAAARRAPAAGDHPPQRRTRSAAHRRPARRDAHLQRQAATQPPQTVDVHRTLRLALEICQRDIDDKGLRVELELRAREHHAEADPARLQQIFWNLIKNAVKFTPEGRRIIVRSVNLSAAGGPRAARARRRTSRLPAPLRPAATGPGERATARDQTPGAGRADFVRVEVIDEGIGIEPQHLRRIFNAFDQGQSSITQRFGGLGLGLAISKAMVEAHGGTSDGGQRGHGQGGDVHRGTGDRARPRRRDRRQRARADGGRRAPARRRNGPGWRADGLGRRVLLVDDHLDTCLGMQRLLKRRGYQVAVAHSVAEALAQAADDECVRSAHQRHRAARRHGFRPDERPCASAAARRGSR